MPSGWVNSDTMRSSTSQDLANTPAYRQVGMPTLTHNSEGFRTRSAFGRRDHAKRNAVISPEYSVISPKSLHKEAVSHLLNFLHPFRPNSYRELSEYLGAFLPTLTCNILAFMFHYDFNISVKTLKSIYFSYSFN
jgi:hypothetical protein